MTTPASPPPADPSDADPPGHARDWSDAELARFAARHHLPGGEAHHKPRPCDTWTEAEHAAFRRVHHLRT